jgi:mediator of RNA polymerase II transcription subunit 7
MADQSQQPSAVDGGLQQLYPPPPPYFRLAEQGLLSPPPLIEGEYPQFGELYTTEDGLPALQVRRVYKINDDGSINIKKQLLALHRELTVSFLELLEVLVDRPSGYARQVENVGLVLRNMIFLANQLRPAQARATVLQSLKATLEAKRQAIENLQMAKQGADDAVNKAIERLKTSEQSIEA